MNTSLSMIALVSVLVAGNALAQPAPAITFDAPLAASMNGASQLVASAAA